MRRLLLTGLCLTIWATAANSHCASVHDHPAVGMDQLLPAVLDKEELEGLLALENIFPGQVALQRNVPLALIEVSYLRHRDVAGVKREYQLVIATGDHRPALGVIEPEVFQRRLIKAWHHQLANNPCPTGWALPTVHHLQRHNYDLDANPVGCASTGQVGAHLRLSDVARSSIRVASSVGASDSRRSSLASLAQSESNVDDANPGDQHTRSRDYNHAESPFRHVPLGGKIGLAALMLVAGLYYLAHALRHGHRLRHGAIVGYSLLGSGGILCGVALGFYAMSGL
jgi:hypothetical protein